MEMERMIVLNEEVVEMACKERVHICWMTYRRFFAQWGSRQWRWCVDSVMSRRKVRPSRDDVFLPRPTTTLKQGGRYATRGGHAAGVHRAGSSDAHGSTVEINC